MSDLHQRIARLSPQQRAALEKQLKNKVFQSSQQLAIQPRMVSDEPVLSYAQQRLWILDQLYPGSAVYTVLAVLRLEGMLFSYALEHSVRALVKRHEILRTTFAHQGGQPIQVIGETLGPGLVLVDLQGLSTQERAQEVKRLTSAEARQPFDLQAGPLLRTTLLRVSSQEHVAFFTLHHIVSDGWSTGIMIRELAANYEALVQGRPALVQALPIQYVDYAVWQREWLSGAVLDKQLAYWRQQLEGMPGQMGLPTDRARGVMQTFVGAQHRLILPARLTEALKALSLQEGATLFMTLLAAFDVLLARHSGQEDIVVGTAVANRGREEVEGLIGCFVNTLVLRTKLSGNPSFREVLKRVREVALGAYAHQDVPFERLVEELQPQREASVPVLFQVWFELNNVPLPSLDLPGLKIHSVPVDSGEVKFDLALSMFETEQGLVSIMRYKTQLFNDATVLRMQEHFLTLLEGIAALPDLPVAELPLLGEQEKHYLLTRLNTTRRISLPSQCFHSLFEAQVEKTPDSLAVVFEDEAITYLELNRQANKLAHYLKGRAVQLETLVGICMERSIEMIICVLAVLKAGGAYVPIDPTFPIERISFIANNTKMQVMLTKGSLPVHLREQDVSTACLATEWSDIQRQRDNNPLVPVGLANLAYIIYTSGSTGKPKGVCVEHRQLLAYVDGVSNYLHFLPGTSFAMVQPLAVDSSVTVVFPPLCMGGRLHVISYARSLDPLMLSDYMQERFIDCLKIAPSHLASLQAAKQPERLLPRRWLIIGGEASHWEWAQRLQAMPHDCEIINHYGPTETTVGTLTYNIKEGQEPDNTYTVPIGRPLPGTEIYVLDRYMNPVSIGVVGELYIGGLYLARGYWSHADVTAERFVPHPFSNVAGERLYKTGDQVRYLPDGNIEFMGRNDRQVKLRGNRLELGEVEKVLMTHRAVRQGVVLLREMSLHEKYLVAYVVLNEGESFVSDELRTFMGQHVPGYMIPSVFIHLDALPTTPHGKLDYNALPVQAEGRYQQPAYVAPRNKLEQMLCDLCQEITHRDHISIHDNFFDLGAHSLSLIIFRTRIRETIGHDVPLIKLFEVSTVSTLAHYLSQQNDEFSPTQRGKERANLRRNLLLKSGKSPQAKR